MVYTPARSFPFSPVPGLCPLLKCVFDNYLGIPSIYPSANDSSTNKATQKLNAMQRKKAEKAGSMYPSSAPSFCKGGNRVSR